MSIYHSLTLNTNCQR